MKKEVIELNFNGMAYMIRKEDYEAILNGNWETIQNTIKKTKEITYLKTVDVTTYNG